MKIVYATDAIPPDSIGGSAKRIYALCKALAVGGHTVVIITSTQKKESAGRTIQDGMEIIRLYSRYRGGYRPYLSLYNPMTVPHIKKVLKEENPDIVHFDTIHEHLSYAVIPMAKRMGFSVIVSLRDAMSFAYGKIYPKNPDCSCSDYRQSLFENMRQARKSFNPFRNFFIRQYIRYADCLTAVSFFLQEALRQNGIIAGQVLHDTLELNLPIPSQDASESFKIRHGLAGKKIIFLPGRLNDAKGVYALVRALPAIIQQEPTACVLFAGAGEEERKKMKEYALRLGVTNSIHILGWVTGEDLANCYALSNVIVVPSLCYDMFPGVNLEAAFYKKAVVATCFGGGKEFVEDGRTGYIINPYRQDELVQKILYLLTNPSLAHEFGARAHEKLLNSYSTQRGAAALSGLYARVARLAKTR